MARTFPLRQLSFCKKLQMRDNIVAYGICIHKREGCFDTFLSIGLKDILLLGLNNSETIKNY